MSVPFEKELEALAQELYDKSVDFPPKEMLPEVLKRTLLPLLQAGQRMRDADTVFDTIGDADLAWDAARERLTQLEKR